MITGEWDAPGIEHLRQAATFYVRRHGVLGKIGHPESGESRVQDLLARVEDELRLIFGRASA